MIWIQAARPINTTKPTPMAPIRNLTRHGGVREASSGLVA
jgi:hypothetical protein